MWKLDNSRGKMAPSIRDEEEIHKGNRIILVHKDGREEEVKSIPNMKIIPNGNNSLVKIFDGYRIAKLNIYVGEGGYIELGKKFNVRFACYIDAKALNATVCIGDNANFGDCHIYAGDEENIEVIIGHNFLCAVELYIRNSDGHTIYDINSGKIVNKPKFGIHIGNHVWCGYNVTVLKDADIPDNCIIGAGAVVGKGVFKENSIIAGTPAKVVRSDVNWDSRSITRYQKDNGGSG